jgi:hypothetical protein
MRSKRFPPPTNPSMPRFLSTFAILALVLVPLVHAHAAAQWYTGDLTPSGNPPSQTNPPPATTQGGWYSDLYPPGYQYSPPTGSTNQQGWYSDLTPGTGNAGAVTNTTGNAGPVNTNTGNAGPVNTAPGPGLTNPLAQAGINSIPDLLNAILRAAVQIGAVVVTLMLVFVGFKFVAAQGAPEKIKEARTMLLWTIIGGLILLGAQVIATVIQSTVGAL